MERLFTYEQISAVIDEMMEKYRQNSDAGIALTQQIIEGNGTRETTLRATRMAARSIGNLEAITILQTGISEALGRGDDHE